MLYFDSLPKVITPDQNGNAILMTNIMSRNNLISELQNNPMLFYKYSVQDGDTPEIVAEKYYEDPYRYWVVLLANQLLDPLWDWPLKYNDLIDYIISKYGSEEAAKLQVHSYEKITTQVENTSGKVTTFTNEISETDYNSLMISSSTYTLPNGATCTVTVNKRIVDKYTYETEANDSKREIKIMDSVYVGQLEKQFQALMKVKK